MKQSYKEQLGDSRWLRKKTEILERDNYTCQKCGATSHLNVHHLSYEKDKRAWEYPNEQLVTLCYECHNDEHDIVTYPKVGNFYKYNHGDYENEMLCYFVDKTRDCVCLFGVDDGAYGTPYILNVTMDDFLVLFRRSLLSFDKNDANYNDYTVRSFSLAYSCLLKNPSSYITNHSIYNNNTHYNFTLSKINEALSIRKDVLKTLNEKE